VVQFHIFVENALIRLGERRRGIVGALLALIRTYWGIMTVGGHLEWLF
jgi:N-acetylglucosamine-6-phosphate deacetylase